jgi:D-lactate dehydrogenase (cytochrome)
VHITTEPDDVAGVLADAAHFPGGHAFGLVHVESEADIATLLSMGRSILPIGAQSSLTGGATPRGEVVVSTARLRDTTLRGNALDAGAGVTLFDACALLESHGALYPPVPTFAGATVGGVIATNAAGPATFKYATTRNWVERLTVVLPSGDVLDIDRGQYFAHTDGYFDVLTTRGPTRVPVTPVGRPDVPKCSAGYALAAGMDLIDLFIGAEGTLGVVTQATLRVIRSAPRQCLALVAIDAEADALELATVLRREALRTWRAADDRGIDVSAIEHADARSVRLLREDGIDRTLDVTLPAGECTLLFVALDLPSGTSREVAWAAVENAMDPGAPDVPLVRFCRLLAARGLLDRTELAFPGDTARRGQLLGLREGVPQSVNRRVALAQQQVSPALSKIAGDFIVPFEAFEPMVAACRDAAAERGLDLAIWGHISDGNIHPNVIPARVDDGVRGREALLQAGQTVIALGGSPLAEHGVGRNPLKQEFLALLHGEAGLAAMRRLKRALDPEGLLAPGVLLPAVALQPEA